MRYSGHVRYNLSDLLKEQMSIDFNFTFMGEEINVDKEVVFKFKKLRNCVLNQSLENNEE